MSRPFRLGEVATSLQAAALAYAKAPSWRTRGMLQFQARRLARALERHRERNR